MAIELDGAAGRPALAGRSRSSRSHGRRARVLRGARRSVPGSLGAPQRRLRGVVGASSRPRTTSIRRSGSSSATATRSPRSSRNEPERNGGGYVGALGVRAAVARQRARARAAPAHVRASSTRAACRASRSASTRRTRPARRSSTSVSGCTSRREHVVYEKALAMSVLRAKCPTCRTLTAVAIGPEYECHSCGRRSRPGSCASRARGATAASAMIEAASLPLDYPEAAVVEEDSLHAQNLALASDLPVRPLILGGCCCSHIGAVEGLAARHERLGVIWFDAHGDLNTPETSPSGNEWGMPLRMIIDGGAVDAARRRARRRAEPRSARGRVHRRRRHPRRPASGARPGRLRLRRDRLRRLRAERARRVHAGAGRARRVAELERAPRPDPRAAARWSAPASPGSRPIRGNVEKLERLDRRPWASEPRNPRPTRPGLS